MALSSPELVPGIMSTGIGVSAEGIKAFEFLKGLGGLP